MSPRTPARRRLRLRTALLAALAALSPPAAAHATDVLFLAETLYGGTSSLEWKIVTTTGAVPGYPGLTGLGLSAHIAPAANWASETYSNYRAIVLGDPNCSSATPAPVAAAEANAAAWANAVTGNVVIIGTDPTVHSVVGVTLAGAQLWRSAIQFAVSGSGTGAVISLSCYYMLANTPTTVNVLSGFGSFTVTRAPLCPCAVAIAASSPALAGLTPASLSNWTYSVHEWFNTWDPSFIPLAIATGFTSPPPNFTAADGTHGHPYILARGNIQPIAAESGFVKVCKVAGAGVTLGMTFGFTAGGVGVSVPAGPAPGGYCRVGPAFPVGTVIQVKENVPAGYGVSAITVAPAAQQVGPVNLATGSVNVTVGHGVTEVTFRDEKKTGFLEICKNGHVGGSFTFSVSPGGVTVTVPAGACSPAIELPAGTVTIHEAPKPGVVMIGCSAFPANRQLSCSPATLTSVVTVVPGDVAAQTIANLSNAPVIHTDTATATGTHGTLHKPE